MFAQELAVSFLKDTTATVFDQGLDVSEKMVELARAPRKRSVAALPINVADRSTARGSVAVSLPDEHDRTTAGVQQSAKGARLSYEPGATPQESTAEASQR